MSTANGPICSTDADYGDPTTSSYPWLLSNKGDTIRIITPRTIATSNSNGLVGEICWDEDYIYVCVANNTWKRAAISDMSF